MQTSTRRSYDAGPSEAFLRSPRVEETKGARKSSASIGATSECTEPQDGRGDAAWGLCLRNVQLRPF